MTSPLRVLVADDERPARSFLTALLRQHAEVTIVGEAADGSSAVRMIEELRPDVAFLDLQMPELDGLEVVRLVKPAAMPLIVFVTAYDEYAVRAFEANAVDYLLKPVEPARLAATLQRVQERLEGDSVRNRSAARAESPVLTAAAAAVGPGYLRRLPVRHHDDIVLLPVERIAAIEADDEAVRVTTAANERFVVNVRLKDLEARLDPARFLRISRSAICNGELIVRVSSLPGGMLQLTLATGLRLTASRIRSRELRDLLLEL
ncbi:MAG: LytR/AlgR family response regulator transcription factor [Gemmatimonadota bacterium]